MKRINLLGLDCSPRKNSNSGALLLHSFESAGTKLKGLFDYSIVALRDLQFSPCRACGVCGEKKNSGEYIPCIQHDGMEQVLAAMKESDGILVATPVYFGLPSDLFSKFIMRTRVLRHQDFQLANKPVAVMATAGRRSGGAETTILSCWLPFIRHGCLIVGNGDATCQFGTMGWAGPCGHILSDEWGLEQGEQTVRRVCEIAELIRAGQEATGRERTPMRFSYTSGNRPVPQED